MDEEIDLAACCRTCLRSNCSLLPINGEDSDAIKFSYKLVSCISEIDWSWDSISCFICDQCIDQLRISYAFHNTCIGADKTIQNSLKKSADTKCDIKDHSLYSPKYKAAETPSKDINLQDEDTNNSEYLHLKHFLDNDEDITGDINKNESVLVEHHNISRSSTPDSTGNFLNNFNQSETIEIEVQDIQEIIIHSKSNETGDNRVILSNGAEYSVQNVDSSTNQISEQIKDLDKDHLLNPEPIVNISHESQIVQQTSDTTDSNIIENTAIVLATYNETTGETILESKKAIPFKLYPKIKATKTTGVQVTSPNLDVKKNPKNSNASRTCNICNKIFKKKANLTVHMRSHTGEKPFECIYCDKRFHHSSHLKEHIRRHTGEKPFQCTLCAKRFTIKGELTMHLRSHTGEKPFACSICDRKCLTSSDLKIHMRIHTGEKPYACDDCGKRFSSPFILNSHLKIHTGERPYSCTICDKNFTQSSHLKVHMRKHTGEKFVCKECPATFNHSSQLTVHKREHSGKQPYKCGVCEKLCNYASELQAHMAKHTGQKFTCAMCLKQFSTAAYLSEHTRTHTGENLFNCSLCDKNFTRQQYLEKHIRTHTGEKPYSCADCGKTFSQSSSLRVHSRIHTGEKPYICNMCDRKFTSSSDLASHIKKHKKYTDL